MLTVVDRTPACVPMRPDVLRPNNVDMVVVHRLQLCTRTTANPHPVPNDRLDADAMREAFERPGMGTGGRVPYHALLKPDLVVEQLLPLVVQGSHASGYNWQSWGVAVVGNYDEIEMPDRVWRTLVDLLAVLAVVPRNVQGHTELHGASLDPSKRCPGRFVSMDRLRAEVDGRLPTGSDAWDIRRRLEYVQRAGFAL